VHGNTCGSIRKLHLSDDETEKAESYFAKAISATDCAAIIRTLAEQPKGNDAKLTKN